MRRVILQTSLSWNTGCLNYVEGSASFSDAFTKDAMVSQINPSEGCIRLAYGNTKGYTAQNETVFTAKFRLAEA